MAGPLICAPVGPLRLACPTSVIGWPADPCMVPSHSTQVACLKERGRVKWAFDCVVPDRRDSGVDLLTAGAYALTRRQSGPLANRYQLAAHPVQ
jgi:hypothetical protein